jgi:hypothetical protein
MTRFVNPVTPHCETPAHTHRPSHKAELRTDFLGLLHQHVVVRRADHQEYLVTIAGNLNVCCEHVLTTIRSEELQEGRLQHLVRVFCAHSLKSSKVCKYPPRVLLAICTPPCHRWDRGGGRGEAPSSGMVLIRSTSLRDPPKTMTHSKRSSR